MKMPLGSDKFDDSLSKVINLTISRYIKKTTGIDNNINFTVKSRRGRDTPFVGCNAGSRGEPYNYVIEIHSDVELPYMFRYSDEYKKEKNKVVDGYDKSILSYEIKQMLPMMGVDIDSLGNVVGICFM